MKFHPYLRSYLAATGKGNQFCLIIKEKIKAAGEIGKKLEERDWIMDLSQHIICMSEY